MNVEEQLRKAYATALARRPYPIDAVKETLERLPEQAGRGGRSWLLGVAAVAGIIVSGAVISLQVLPPRGTGPHRSPVTASMSVSLDRDVVLSMIVLPGGAFSGADGERPATVLFAVTSLGDALFREYRQGHSLGHARCARLSAAQVDALVAYSLSEGGLADAPEVFERQSIGPSSRIVFSVRSDGATKDVEYQLAIGNLLRDADPAVAGIRSLAERLTSFSDEVSAWTDCEPEREIELLRRLP